MVHQYHTLLPKWLRNHCERGEERILRIICREDQRKHCIVHTIEPCTHELTAAVVDSHNHYAKSSRTIFHHARVRNHESVPLVQKLMTVGGFWGRASQFSLKVCTLQGDYAPEDGFTGTNLGNTIRLCQL